MFLLKKLNLINITHNGQTDIAILFYMPTKNI